MMKDLLAKMDFKTVVVCFLMLGSGGGLGFVLPGRPADLAAIVQRNTDAIEDHNKDMSEIAKALDDLADDIKGYAKSNDRRSQELNSRIDALLLANRRP